MWETLKDVGLIVGIPLVRGVAGWLNHALQDGAIDKFEVERLIQTIINIGVPGIAGYFSLNLLGLDVELMGVLVAVAVVDWFISRLREE